MIEERDIREGRPRSEDGQAADRDRGHCEGLPVALRRRADDMVAVRGCARNAEERLGIAELPIVPPAPVSMMALTSRPFTRISMMIKRERDRSAATPTNPAPRSMSALPRKRFHRVQNRARRACRRRHPCRGSRRLHRAHRRRSRCCRRDQATDRQRAHPNGGDPRASGHPPQQHVRRLARPLTQCLGHCCADGLSRWHRCRR